LALRIAAIADTHYSGGSLDGCGTRRTAIADTLLLRAVRRLNRFIKPDLTVILGDLLEDGCGPRSREEHERLSEIIGKLESPVIVMPGNHDGDLDAFYSIYPRPAEVIDINGVRVLTFLDSEEPGYNARRSSADLTRMDQARAGHDGPIVSLQHVPLFQPGASASPYGFTNADEVWAAFERNHFTLAVSGHGHPGDDLVARGAGRAVIVPALCESPFAFAEIIIDGDNVETRRHELRLPSGLELTDYHVHTPFAYCSENMDAARSMELAKEFGLAGLALTEHSGQLYFDRETFWSASFLRDGIDTVQGFANRMPDYLALAREFCPPAYLGLEIDCDNSGNPVVRREDWDQAQVRLGSIHWLDELRKPEPDLDAAAKEMLGRLSRFLGCGIQILAHPLRVFRKWPNDLPPSLVPRMLALLREHGVAAEINFHVQDTSPEFLTACVESGVKVVFGSDSHNLYEVGEFYPHLDLLRRCGLSESDLPRILADIRPGQCHFERSEKSACSEGNQKQISRPARNDVNDGGMEGLN
jgi:histidinol phosphatase-like PHP family hydrolase/predicted phosphodiesterase